MWIKASFMPFEQRNVPAALILMGEKILGSSMTPNYPKENDLDYKLFVYIKSGFTRGEQVCKGYTRKFKVSHPIKFNHSVEPEPPKNGKRIVM